MAEIATANVIPQMLAPQTETLPAKNIQSVTPSMVEDAVATSGTYIEVAPSDRKPEGGPNTTPA